MSNFGEVKSELLFDQEVFASRLAQLVGDEPLRPFARRAGMTDTGLRRYMFDGSEPSASKMMGLAQAGSVKAGASPTDVYLWLSCLTDSIGDRYIQIPTSPLSISESSSHFSDSKGTASSDNEFTLIDSFAVFASAGHGTEVGSELRTEPMSFRTDWLKKEGFPEDRLAVIRAKGDSMEPTISDNDVILVLLSNGDAPRDGLHVIRLDGGLFVKRLQFDPFGGLSVVSDNPSYKSYAVSKEQRPDVHIIGRVVWAGKKF
jgi:phage repressor protein C with HTH and peptisase S24 domain